MHCYHYASGSYKTVVASDNVCQKLLNAQLGVTFLFCSHHFILILVFYCFMVTFLIHLATQDSYHVYLGKDLELPSHVIMPCVEG